MGLYEDYVLPHLINLSMRNSQLMPYRQRLLASAQGRVLEIGIGSGANLSFYPPQMTEIIGLDPHPKLLAMACHKKGSISMTAIEGSAESIPLEDHSIDTAVTT